MSATSVGQIGLDLVVNQNQFNQQMAGVQSLASKTGKMLVAAFGVKQLITFSKECVNLGSDLQEVQNVVDVTFPNMTKRVNEFSKSAVASFGLSETMAKKFTGTFGSMAKAFGFSEKQAYEMGSTLAGLAGDVASFYNITQDEAYTKLKSVFSGETETLKDLGVVMTQTALDSYALANGFNKTTKSMSEAEKVALRYAFVQDQLSAASGDFARTSDGWANQVRVLTLQFDSLKATLGQGLINILTPVVKVINTLIGKLIVLAESFKSFTELITGKKSSNTQMATTIKEADVLTDSVAGIGAAAKKSAKEMRALAGFDELNNLSSSSSAETTSGTTGNAGIISSSGTIGNAEQSANSVMGSLDGLQKKLEKIANLTGFDRFWKETQKGIDKIDFKAIKVNSQKIFSELQPIAKSAFDGISKVAKNYTKSIGTVLGGLVSVAGKHLETVSGGVSKFLRKEGNTITNWIKTMSSKMAKGYDNISFSAEKIFGSFWDALDENQVVIETSISNYLSTLTNMEMLVGTVYSNMFETLTEKIANFTTNESSLINGFLNGIINSATLMANTVTSVVGDLFASLSSWWTTDGKRIWEEIVNVFLEIVAWVTKIWINTIKPVIDELSKELNKLWDEHLKPLWDNVLSFLTSVWDFLLMVWNVLLKPILNWIEENIGPTIMNVVNAVVRVVGVLLAYVIDVAAGMQRSLKGVLNFLTGVFTGDWKKAWNGIKDFLGGIWDAIWASIKATINLIIEGINTLWSGLYSSLRTVLNGVGKALGKIGDAVGKDLSFTVPKKAPQIPQLARGGYVKANTPQLAIIGDNLHQGEIVSPEDKLEQMALKAAQMAGGNSDNAMLHQIILLLQRQNEILLGILEKEFGISGKDIFDTTRSYAREYTKRTGNPAFEY